MLATLRAFAAAEGGALTCTSIDEGWAVVTEHVNVEAGRGGTRAAGSGNPASSDAYSPDELADRLNVEAGLAALGRRR